MSSLRAKSLAFAAVVLLGLSACGGDSGDETTDTASTGEPVVIATTNFSETKILANIYQQALSDNGVEASIKELTTREVIMPALQQGEVQITPEYLGSLSDFLNKQANGPDAEPLEATDAEALFAEAQTLASDTDVTLLTMSPAQDQNAFAVTAAFAEEHDLQTVSDLAAYSQDSPVTLGGPPECPQRTFCQIGLEEVYDVNVGSFVALDAGGPLTIQALKQGKVDVGVVFSSSGSVTANDLVVLEDDQSLQTPENIVPAVWTPALTPGISDTLNAVSAALTTEALQAMNAAVEIDRKDPATVAAEFLADNDLS